MLTPDEMREFSSGVLEKQFEGAFGRTAHWKELFSIMDANNDGQISFQEFLTGACDKARLLNEDKLRVAFALLDKNGDGYLDLEEIKWRFTYVNTDSLITELNVNEDFWPALLEDFDRNQDGYISFDEFKQCMTDMLERHTEN